MTYMIKATPAPTERMFIRFARLVWFSLTLMSLALFVSGLPSRYYQLVGGADPRVLRQLGISVSGYAFYLILLNILMVVVHCVIAAVLFMRQKRDWMALWLAFALVANGVIFPLSLMYPADTTPIPARTLVEIIIFVGLVSSVSLLYIFPDGKFVPRWTVWLALIWALINLPSIILPDSPLGLRNWSISVQLIILIALSATGVVAQIYRYVRVSNPTQRQQAKWALYGLTAAVLGPLAYFVPFVILPTITGGEVPNLLFNRIGPAFYTYSFIFRLVAVTLFTVLSLLFPISFSIAILRYKLWDIDIFINRALVYGALTGLLAVIYLCSVVLLQQAIQFLTGFSRSEVATAASTLLIAAMFVPLQRRIQALIDQKFFRRKYNAMRILAAFNHTLRDEVELEPLVNRLVDVVEDTVQPEHISVWLREPEEFPLEELDLVKIGEKDWLA